MFKIVSLDNVTLNEYLFINMCSKFYIMQQNGRTNIKLTKVEVKF